MSNDVSTKRFKPRTTVSTEVHQVVEIVTMLKELDLLFGPLFDEYFNGENQVVLKSSVVTTTDASNKRQQPDSTSSTSTLATTVTANGNFDFFNKYWYPTYTVEGELSESEFMQYRVETPENLFVAPANIHTIEAFMNRVGYQGVIYKVSAFFTKNLAQPWQNMFKVFNRSLTTRTSGHDQTKINILQLFHVLIIADQMKKFPNIPKRIEKDYHSIRDDVPLCESQTGDFLGLYKV
ncbi:hypothetical protein Tco_0540949 [Tanacetum coccineum]